MQGEGEAPVVLFMQEAIALAAALGQRSRPGPVLPPLRSGSLRRHLGNLAAQQAGEPSLSYRPLASHSREPLAAKCCRECSLGWHGGPGVNRMSSV